MSRLLVQSEWYASIDAPDVYEAEFERIVLSRADVLFPGFWAIPFKAIVSSDSGSARADYALVDRAYRDWWVVEVELSEHSLHGHVIPQVGVLATARYGMDEARALAARLSSLEPARMRALMKGLPPRVLVVVERPMPDWSFVLKRYGIHLAVFEIFRSQRDRLAFRVNGYVPAIRSDALSDCWLDPALPSLLRLTSPAAVAPGVGSGQSLEMEVDGRLSLWEVLSTAGDTWLVSRSRNPLRKGVRYEISRRADGTLVVGETRGRPQ